MTALFAVLVFAWLEPTTTATSPPASEPNASDADAVPDDAHASLRGVVTDKRAKTKVPGLVVVLRGPDGEERRTVTNEAGLYAFDDLPAGQYTVEARHGKQTAAHIFSLEGHQMFRSNFSIDPEQSGRVVMRSTPIPRSDGPDAQGAIGGVVTNSRTKAKIAGVPVVLRGSDGSERRTVASEHGLYVFRELPAAEYTVEVQHGKATVAKIFALERDRKVRANISLDPEHAFSRTVRVLSTPVSTPSKRALSASRRERRGCARFYRAWERAFRQKARRDARAQRRRGRHDS